MNSSFFEQENIQSKMKKRLSRTAKHWFKTHASVKVYEVADVQKLWKTESTSKVKKIILDILRPIDRITISISGMLELSRKICQYMKWEPKSFLLHDKYKKEILDRQKKMSNSS